MDTYTNEKVNKALKKFLRKVNSKYPLKQALLFGSRARDDWLVTSDVDILLVSDTFSLLPIRERMASVLEWWNEGVDLEPLCYTQAEFQRMKLIPGIVKNAAAQGIDILKPQAI